MIRITTTPVEMGRVAWAFSAPGPLTSLELGMTQWSDVPGMLAGVGEVIAGDEFGNPIANAEVVARLTPPNGALLGQQEAGEYLAAGGTVLLDEIADPSPILAGRVTSAYGKAPTYVVLGAEGDEAEQTLQFQVTEGDHTETGSVIFFRRRPDDGEILYSWSARAVGSQGQWIEAYNPGSEVGRPFSLDLFRFRGGTVERADRDDLRAAFALSGCPAGSVLVGVPEPQTEGRWATGLRLGPEPGSCRLTASIEEHQPDGTWQVAEVTGPSAAVWGVAMEFDEPLPPVLVDAGGNPGGAIQLGYTVEPEGYVPERIAGRLIEDGRTLGLAQTWGRGDGEVTLPPSGIKLNIERGYSVQLVLNPGVRWMESAGLAQPSLEVRSGEHPLTVLTFHLGRLWEAENPANRIFNPTRKDDPASPEQQPDVNGETYGVPRNKLYVVADEWNRYDCVIRLAANPPGLCNDAVVAVFRQGEKVSGTDTTLAVDCDGDVGLSFEDPSMEAAVTDFEVRVGLDRDGDGLLDPEEPQIRPDVFEDPGTGEPQFVKIRGIKRSLRCARFGEQGPRGGGVDCWLGAGEGCCSGISGG